MTFTSKKLGIPLIVFIGGTALLGTIWWINGAEREDLWLYLIAVWFMLYAAYELFVGMNKRKDQ